MERSVQNIHEKNTSVENYDFIMQPYVTISRIKLRKTMHRSRTEVTNMRPAKEFPAAREHFGETSTFKNFFPRLIFAMRYQKLSP